MKKIYFLLFTMFFFTAAFAQVDVSTVDSTAIIVEQNINIFKDPRLDILDTRPKLMAKIISEEEKKAASTFKPLVSSDGKKKLTGSIYTTKGFRVVIYNGADRAKAIEAKNIFTRSFPGEASFISYNVPSYKIKVGNFESRNDATKFMKRLNKAFPSSFIVPDIVTIKNINVSN